MDTGNKIFMCHLSHFTYLSMLELRLYFSLALKIRMVYDDLGRNLLLFFYRRFIFSATAISRSVVALLFMIFLIFQARETDICLNYKFYHKNSAFSKFVKAPSKHHISFLGGEVETGFIEISGLHHHCGLFEGITRKIFQSKSLAT